MAVTDVDPVADVPAAVAVSGTEDCVPPCAYDGVTATVLQSQLFAVTVIEDPPLTLQVKLAHPADREIDCDTGASL